jgi:hypothetical protein
MLNRELFAVKLRKAKKQSLINKKRQTNIVSHFIPAHALIKQYQEASSSEEQLRIIKLLAFVAEDVPIAFIL